MTRVVFHHEGSEVVEFSYCHCEEDYSPTRQSIVSRQMEQVSGSVTEGQWIATGLRPRDDKVEGVGRLVGYSGSPRATPSR